MAGLPYPGWNVVFGATPTAAYWSELGANDDALAAGTGLNNGAITFTSLLSTIFGGQVSTQTNSGSAGGTMKYINLGGIKLLWALSGSVSTAASSTSYNFTLPTGFFTTVTTSIATAALPSGFADQFATIASQNTTTVAIYLTSGGSGSGFASLLVIGT